MSNRLPKLAALSRKLHAAAPAIVDAESRRTADRMRQLAPDRTGELIEGIREIPAVESGGVVRGGVAVVGGHAASQEFGTAHNPPHPFARPAERESAERRQIVFPRDIRQALK